MNDHQQCLRPQTGLLRCCVGIRTMFQCLIHQFLGLFANGGTDVVSPGYIGPSCHAHLVPDDPSSIRNSPAHDTDPIPDDPSSSTTQGTSNSENPSSCRYAEMEKIKDQLISRSPSDLKVVPIVGMGGIGKTNLAKTLYEDAVVSRQFHLRALIAISQDYNLDNVLLGLLRSVDPDRADEVRKQKNPDLERALYQSLKGRRYLIVLDDIWSHKTWNDFNSVFPNDANGSRILLTTRLVEVACYVEPNHPPHHLDCLSHEESWRLLQTKVFQGKACPSDLEEIGKEISKKCQGLPLAIVVIAGHLSNVDKRKDSWADVAKRIDSLITGSEEQILDILSLSYNHLPPQLKACFLYMGIFPKNSEIRKEYLIRMLTAAGWLQSEDESEKCIEDLINRNLIIVRKKKHGIVKTCGIHDLLWELILREALKEGPQIFKKFNYSYCLSCATTHHDDMMKYLMDITSTYRYLGSCSNNNSSLNFVCNCFRRLRVLEIQSKEFFSFPEIITGLRGLRYLELSTSEIPESLSGLHNLETLIIGPIWRSFLSLPKEIWSLKRLRHLQVKNGIDLCASIATFSDLQTLSTVRFTSCTDNVFSRIPNLKQLKISDIDGEKDQNISNLLRNLFYLSRLEKLNLHFSSPVRGQITWENFIPSSVKQLTLSGSRLQWEEMNNLAKLPNIEVLKLKNYAFEGRIYEQTIEGFPRLKFLLLEKLHLSNWKAETSDHYPKLQQLVLRHCYFLKEIPCCFEEIPTLECIELGVCSELAHQSARTIQQGQLNNGNDAFQVRFSENHGDYATMKQKREAWSSLENNNQLTPMEKHRAKRRRGN